MRRLALALFIAVSALIANAQGSMTIRDFRPEPNDLSANTAGTMRKSKQDGKASALLKIATNQEGFTFDGGTFGIVDVAQYPGEVWVYVPARAQKLKIMHKRFGVLEFEYPGSIESGRVYKMTLDPGAGKYATIQTSTPHSPVYLDGDSLGVSPLYNEYILWGEHTLSSRNGRMDGKLAIDIVNDGDPSTLNFIIPMEDQSVHYGTVIVNAEPDVDIIFNGKQVGLGRWQQELYKGDYTIETRKKNCDNQVTSFTVKPQQTITVKALPPTPHVGYLNLFTRPIDPNFEIDNKKAELQSKIALPVGRHSVRLTRKDYDAFEKDYDIRHNENVFDTIYMHHIQFVTPNAFYFGAAYTVGTFSGVTGMIGGRYSNIDLQLAFMFGLSKSNTVYYYNTGNSHFLGSAQYKLNTISAKVGYSIPFSAFFGITPQVGYAAHMLSSTGVTGQVLSKSGSAACATVGARFVYAPLRNASLFVAPEYDIAVSKGKQFSDIAEAAGFSAGGFFCNIGVMVNF